MKPFARSIFDLFDGKKRYIVPLYQRQYAWEREAQWEPLWEDIRRKLSMHIERQDGPPHFLGAMVIDQKKVFGDEVQAYLVIDGQQRLTTFQIFLAAFRDLCSALGREDRAEECHRYLLNTGMMAKPEEEKFKVWPSELDRGIFADVVDAGSKAEIERRHPVRRKKYCRKPEPRPRMVECYLYFYEEMEGFLSNSHPEYAHLEKVGSLFQTLRGSLQVVTIELDGDDDPQVIFETLNARGAPLLPSDLLRNFIFWRAAKDHGAPDALYQKYWLPFDGGDWAKKEKQGRIERPRTDLFLQHYLALKRCQDINIGHLFAEYKHWITAEAPFASVEDELREMAQHRGFYQRLVEPDQGTGLGRLAGALKAFDTRMGFPLIMGVLDRELPEEAEEEIFEDLQSYVVRRALCGLTTKNYNRLFISLLAKLPEELNRATFRALLTDLQGDSAVWPRDDAFRNAWLENDSYEDLESGKIRFVLRAIEDRLRSSKSEVVEIKSELTVEHIMPEAWIKNWPLPNGRTGVPFEERENELAPMEDILASVERDRILHSFGNLTLVTQPLNSGMSNAGFEDKRSALMEHATLALNRYLHDKQVWNEEAIRLRGDALFEHAKTIWPYGPGA